VCGSNIIVFNLLHPQDKYPIPIKIFIFNVTLSESLEDINDFNVGMVEQYIIYYVAITCLYEKLYIQYVKYSLHGDLCAKQRYRHVSCRDLNNPGRSSNLYP
jgi:hypothetical protein